MPDNFIPKQDQQYWSVGWGWENIPCTHWSIWTGTSIDYQNLYLGNCFKHKRGAEAYKNKYYERITGKKFEEKHNA